MLKEQLRIILQLNKTGKFNAVKQHANGFWLNRAKRRDGEGHTDRACLSTKNSETRNIKTNNPKHQLNLTNRSWFYSVIFLSWNNVMLLKSNWVTFVITMNCNGPKAVINLDQEGGKWVPLYERKDLRSQPWPTSISRIVKLKPAAPLFLWWIW